VPVTVPQLRALQSLDDLIGFVASLGYTPSGHELNPEARARVGLNGSTGTLRAAIVGRHGPFRVYGVQMADASRALVGLAAERLARATPGEQQLVFALEPGSTLAVAAMAPRAGRSEPRQLRIALTAPSPAAAEILGGLTPRNGEGALALSVRLADVLAEEGLTRRFFRELTRLFAQASAEVSGMPRATGSERREFALVVITRVLFLYFVQAKGWLAGRSDFLPSALDTALGRGHPFHRSVFEPLCFGALNAPRHTRSRESRALGDVPFLNGGLFERHAIERRYPQAHFGNETWRDLFDQLFERFHFTVRERDDRDAVDPEMLGRVFEGLMAADRRRQSGTYFTPPALLRDTVRAALDAALTGDAPADLQRIRILDPAVGSGAFLLEALLQLEQRRVVLAPDEDPVERRRDIVRENLYGVDIDPMAVRLAELRLWLALIADDEATPAGVAPLPNLDRNLRQGDSLLSPLDLARTANPALHSPRLGRVAEERQAYFAATGAAKTKLAQRLRSLERAIAIEATDAAIATLTARLADAASLTGPDLFGTKRRRTRGEAGQVAAWRRQRRELIAVRRRIGDDDALPFFSFDVHFGDILAAGGFDVVLGNPPWVRGERLPASARIALARQYEAFRAATALQPHARFAHVPDLAVAFVERAVKLTRRSGVVAMTLPSKLMRAGYAGPLRALVRREAAVLALDDRAHGERSGFDATVFPSVWVLRRETPRADASATVSVHAASAAVLRGHARQDELALTPDVAAAPWLGLPGPAVQALRRALQAGPPLASVFKPSLGVKTGANECFVRETARAHELPADCRVPAILGRDLAPFRLTPSCVMLAAIDGDGRPLAQPPRAVAEFLRPHTARLARRADAKGEPPDRPWTLFRTELLRARWIVLWRDIADRLEAAVLERRDARSPIPLNTCYGAAVPDRYTAHWLAAWLNSAPARAIAAALAERASGGAFRFAAATVGALPLPPDTSSATVRALSDLGAAAVRHEWSSHDLDSLAARALGLDAGTSAELGRLGDALRRNTDRHR
jgi:hypothetical protein